MTFCLGMKLNEGLLGIADTRITSGTECITARKVTLHRNDQRAFFLMTSGLRSVRDKALTYFEEYLESVQEPFDRLYEAVNALAHQVRRVAEEDYRALEISSLKFDFHALVGGQFTGDMDHKLYLLYPQGNWIEIGPGTPYCIIGESGYGKPILDRTLQFNDSLEFAVKVGVLAFDSTRISAANVDFPIDVVVLNRCAGLLHQHRLEKGDLLDMSNLWQDQLRTSVNHLSSEWLQEIFSTEQPSNHGKGSTIPIRSIDLS